MPTWDHCRRARVHIKARHSQKLVRASPRPHFLRSCWPCQRCPSRSAESSGGRAADLGSGQVHVAEILQRQQTLKVLRRNGSRLSMGMQRRSCNSSEPERSNCGCSYLSRSPADAEGIQQDEQRLEADLSLSPIAHGRDLAFTVCCNASAYESQLHKTAADHIMQTGAELMGRSLLDQLFKH